MSYLCQPREGVSCSKCCGVYNFRDYSKEGIARVLKKRRELFDKIVEIDVENIEGILKEYKEQVSSHLFWKEVNNYPLNVTSGPTKCDFTAFIDDDYAQVGCLVHPKRLGRDFRDFGLSIETCNGFYNCGTFENEFKESVLENPECNKIISDWHIYGLVIERFRLRRKMSVLSNRHQIALLNNRDVLNIMKNIDRVKG